MTFCPPRSARPKASPNLPLNSDRSRRPVGDGELLTRLEPVFRASARVLVLGSLPGAMLGGILIGLIEAFWSAYFTIEYKDVATFTILVLVLIFRPTGLLGRPEIEKV